MNQTSFKQLYLVQWPRLYGMALRILGNKEDASDAVQDVFRKLLEEADRLDEVGSPEGYATTLTRRRCIDLLRRRATRTALPLEEAPPIQAGAQADELSQTEYLRACIEALPPAQSLVIKLRVYEGLDNKEIARETGISDETVRQQLSRARRKLKELISKRR